MTDQDNREFFENRESSKEAFGTLTLRSTFIPSQKRPRIAEMWKIKKSKTLP